jgi:hypothetical protein
MSCSSRRGQSDPAMERSTAITRPATFDQITPISRLAVVQKRSDSTYAPVVPPPTQKPFPGMR